MIRRTIVVGPAQCNCMILACKRTSEAVIVDPGDDAERILEEVHRLQVKVKYILHTHAHFDHVCATEKVKQATNAVTYLHRADSELYRNLPLQGQLFGIRMLTPPPMDKSFEEDEILSFGKHKLQVLSTPGHSPGCVCFKFLTAEGELLSGDTLFKQGIGRTDLWGGDEAQLLRSIREKLFVFDDSTEVLPGHGPPTHIGNEKQNNPFFL